jgi:hypothetical protein
MPRRDDGMNDALRTKKIRYETITEQVAKWNDSKLDVDVNMIIKFCGLRFGMDPNLTRHYLDDLEEFGALKMNGGHYTADQKAIAYFKTDGQEATAKKRRR